MSDQFLIAALTVSVRTVEKIYADLTRAAQGLDRRISVGLIVERRHRRTAETDRGNLKPAEAPPLHLLPPQTLSPAPGKAAVRRCAGQIPRRWTQHKLLPISKWDQFESRSGSEPGANSLSTR